MTTTEDAPVVVRDVFPAEVTLSTGEQYRSARVVVTRARVYVWIGDRRERVAVLERPYLPEVSIVPRYNAPPREPSHLALEGGVLVTVRRMRGCGCGSPLTGWQPWTPFRIAAT
jgi:hypothetical protein